jgi:hypothetical protein
MKKVKSSLEKKYKIKTLGEKIEIIKKNFFFFSFSKHILYKNLAVKNLIFMW